MKKTAPPASPVVKKHSRKRQTVQIAGWGKPHLKAALARIAAEEGISLSQTVVAFLEAGVRQQLHIQQELLAQPILEAVMEKKLNRLSNQLADFLGRSVFETGQLRWLFVNLLYRDVLFPNKPLTKEEFYDLLDTSSKETLKNLHSFVPPFSDAIAAIKQRLKNAEEGSA